MTESLELLFPDIAKDWDYDKNSPLRPDQIGHGSTKKVYWICEKGHSYAARIDHRTIMHSGCPYCGGKLPIIGENDLQTVYPDIAEEWDYEKNDRRPEEYLPRSNKAVFWKCPVCGYSYKKTIAARTIQAVGCPNCLKEKGTSFQEQSVLYYLSLTQKAENRSNLFGEEVDIFLPELNTGIEYNGKYYHRNRGEKDLKKQRVLSKNGIRLIVIEEAENNILFDDRIEIKSSNSGHVKYPDLEWMIRQVFDLLGITRPDVNILRDQISIKQRYIISRKANNFAAQYPDIAKEWNQVKNGTLRPENFMPKSHHKAYFDCDVCGTTYLRKICDRVIGMECPVCAGKQVKKGYNDLATTDPALVLEWHERNELKPDKVTRGTDKKVWWKCPKCHYEWKATVSSRTTGNVGCPVCAGKVVIPGYNDFATLYPDIASEWDKDKNKGILPSQLRPGSNKKIWWKCNKCGYEWKTTVSSRTTGRNCPKCARKAAAESRLKTYVKTRGSLRDLYPSIADEWDYNKNGEMTPDNVTAGSDARVWWICRTCKNNWQAVISSRTLNGNGCPECGKKKCVQSFQKRRLEEKRSLAEQRPDLAKQWDYKANAPLLPSDVTVGSSKKVSWICSKGHRWTAAIHTRQKCGCPYCSGRKAIPGETDFGTVFPELLKEWSYEYNKDINPLNYTVGSYQKAYWKCSKCGHIWQTEIKTRTSGCGCPKCSEKKNRQ